MRAAASCKLFRTSAHVRCTFRASCVIVTNRRWVSNLVLSDGFSEGKLKDLRSPFPSDKPTVLDDRDILDDGDLENAEEDVKFNVSPQTSQLGSTGDLPSIYTLRPSNPGAHLGKVVVLCDIPFAT